MSKNVGKILKNSGIDLLKWQAQLIFFDILLAVSRYLNGHWKFGKIPTNNPLETNFREADIILC